jgi:hypothetical protein
VSNLVSDLYPNCIFPVDPEQVVLSSIRAVMLPTNAVFAKLNCYTSATTDPNAQSLVVVVRTATINRPAKHCRLGAATASVPIIGLQSMRQLLTHAQLHFHTVASVSTVGVATDFCIVLVWNESRSVAGCKRRKSQLGQLFCLCLQGMRHSASVLKDSHMLGPSTYYNCCCI